MTDSITRLRRWMDDHESEMVSFLGRIVDMDTATEYGEGVERLAALMADSLRDLGFAVERVDPVPPPEAWVESAFLFGRGVGGIPPSVLGRLGGGTGRGRLLMTAHVDAAFPVGEPGRNPFRIEGGRAYGPAVADMKGGVVGVLFACRALLETGTVRPEEIAVIYDTDEQAGTVCTRPLIEALCRKVTALHALHDPDHGVLLNVGVIGGGTRRNLYAGRAEARMDIRVVDPPTWERVRRDMEAIAAREHVPGTRATLDVWQHRPPMAWTPRTDRLASLVSACAEAMGTRVDTIATMGGSDANLIAAQGTPALCGLGPVGGAVMTRDEYIELPTLAERTALVAGLAHLLATRGI